MLYIVHFTAFCLGGGPFFSGHGVHVVGGDFYAYKQHDHISEYLYFGKLAVTFHLCIIVADVCVKIVLMLL